MGLNILIVDDQKKHNQTLARSLKLRGNETYSCANSEQAYNVLKKNKIDYILLDIMLDNEDGISLIPNFINTAPESKIIMITAYGTISSAVKALKLGAEDYIQKPIDIEHLVCMLQSNTIRKSGKKNNSGTMENSGIITRNRQMLSVIEKAKLYASSDLPALIIGESGTGKELLADLIHANSSYSEKAMHKINSSAFSESLLESELFGHEEGSFTGAKSTHKGIFERANHSSLFMDEIGDMPLSLQAKILRTIQNHEILRLGGKDTIKINVRFIAATNKDLYTLVHQNLFRQDLYYRLNTGIFRLPPLRERKEDIPDLVKFFIASKKQKFHDAVELDDSVINFFLDYDWPGNVRELQSVIFYADAICRDGKIKKEHLPEYILSELSPSVCNGLNFQAEYDDRDEKTVIEKTLKEMNYIKKDVAFKLGISRQTLYRKMEKYNINGQKQDETAVI